MKYYTLYFGQAYGDGNYGDCTYSPNQSQECSTSAGGGTSSGTSNSDAGANGSLSNTGIAVVAIVTIACLIVFVSLVVRIWRRKPAVQPVAADDTTDQNDLPQRQ